MGGPKGIGIDKDLMLIVVNDNRFVGGLGNGKRIIDTENGEFFQIREGLRGFNQVTIFDNPTGVVVDKFGDDKIGGEKMTADNK